MLNYATINAHYPSLKGRVTLTKQKHGLPNLITMNYNDLKSCLRDVQTIREALFDTAATASMKTAEHSIGEYEAAMEKELDL